MNSLGKFNINALENAEEKSKKLLGQAREKIEEILAIPNKTYMNYFRKRMDIYAELEEFFVEIFHIDMVNNSEETQKITAALLPMMSDFYADMARDKRLYDAVLEIREREYDTLTTEQRRAVDEEIISFKIAGIELPAYKKALLKELTTQIELLGNEFQNNVIAANKLNKIKITDEAVLGEMPKTDKDTARVEGGWEFSLLAPSYSAFITYVKDRELREKMYKNSVTRAPENTKVIEKLLALKKEYSEILGLKNYAEFRLQARDAKSPAQVNDFLGKILTAARPAAVNEVTELNAFAGFDVKPWDFAFYSNLMLKKKFDLDESKVKEYFELNHTLSATLDIISEMFEIEFKEREATKWHQEVKYFDIVQNGKIASGIYLDLQTRESKNSGAWMNGFSQHHMDANDKEHLAEVVVVANFPKESGETPSLLSLEDVRTLFHEMGHALHGALSKTSELDLSGTSVYKDVVEFPSQFLENFKNNPVVLERLAKHHKTGEKMPKDMIEKIIASDNFLAAYGIVRQLGFGMFDMKLYTSGKALKSAEIRQIYNEVNKNVSVIEVPDYNAFYNTFSHIFGGGYAAGYYSYMWANQMAIDAYVALKKDPFNREKLNKYRDTVLAKGNTKNMSDLYIEFMGREPNPNSLLEFYGLKNKEENKR